MAHHDGFWLVGDDRLPTGHNARLQRVLKASLIQSMLFTRNLYLSDSQVLCNRNIRQLLARDGTVRDLVRRQMLCVARRQTALGDTIRLTDLRDEFIRDGKQGKQWQLEEFKRDGELKFLENQAKFKQYTLEAVSRRFDTQALSAIRDARSEALLHPEDIAIVRQQVNSDFDALVSEQDLGRAYFHYTLPEILKGKTRAGDLDVRRALETLANGPYFTALPEVLGLEPMYAQEHRESMDIYRRRSIVAAAPRFNTTMTIALGPLTFVKGLLSLTGDDIARLKATDEARAYFAVLENAEDSQAAFDALVREYKDYIAVISDRIVQKTPSAAYDSEEAARIGFDMVALGGEGAGWLQFITTLNQLRLQLLSPSALLLNLLALFNMQFTRKVLRPPDRTPDTGKNPRPIAALGALVEAKLEQVAGIPQQVTRTVLATEDAGVDTLLGFSGQRSGRK